MASGRGSPTVGALISRGPTLYSLGLLFIGAAVGGLITGYFDARGLALRQQRETAEQAARNTKALGSAAADLAVIKSHIAVVQE
jgi:hypothetical protein